jgi:hypothetical protein
MEILHIVLFLGSVFAAYCCLTGWKGMLESERRLHSLFQIVTEYEARTRRIALLAVAREILEGPDKHRLEQHVGNHVANLLYEKAKEIKIPGREDEED